jgi:hypothetical protein
VKVWGPIVSFSAGPLTPLSVAVHDPIGESANSSVATTRILEQFTRYPDQAARASVGYEYPITQQSVALATIAGSTVNLLSMSGVGSGSLIYYSVLWRSGSPTPTREEVHFKSSL